MRAIQGKHNTKILAVVRGVGGDVYLLTRRACVLNGIKIGTDHITG